MSSSPSSQFSPNSLHFFGPTGSTSAADTNTTSATGAANTTSSATGAANATNAISATGVISEPRHDSTLLRSPDYLFYPNFNRAALHSPADSLAWFQPFLLLWYQRVQAYLGILPLDQTTDDYLIGMQIRAPHVKLVHALKDLQAYVKNQQGTACDLPELTRQAVVYLLLRPLLREFFTDTQLSLAHSELRQKWENILATLPLVTALQDEIAAVLTTKDFAFDLQGLELEQQALRDLDIGGPLSTGRTHLTAPAPVLVSNTAPAPASAPAGAQALASQPATVTTPLTAAATAAKPAAVLQIITTTNTTASSAAAAAAAAIATASGEQQQPSAPLLQPPPLPQTTLPQAPDVPQGQSHLKAASQITPPVSVLPLFTPDDMMVLHLFYEHFFTKWQHHAEITTLSAELCSLSVRLLAMLRGQTDPRDTVTATTTKAQHSAAAATDTPTAADDDDATTTTTTVDTPTAVAIAFATGAPVPSQQSQVVPRRKRGRLRGSGAGAAQVKAATQKSEHWDHFVSFAEYSDHFYRQEKALHDFMQAKVRKASVPSAAELPLWQGLKPQARSQQQKASDAAAQAKALEPALSATHREAFADVALDFLLQSLHDFLEQQWGVALCSPQVQLLDPCADGGHVFLRLLRHNWFTPEQKLHKLCYGLKSIALSPLLAYITELSYVAHLGSMLSAYKSEQQHHALPATLVQLGTGRTLGELVSVATAAEQFATAQSIDSLSPSLPSSQQPPPQSQQLKPRVSVVFVHQPLDAPPEFDYSVHLKAAAQLIRASGGGILALLLPAAWLTAAEGYSLRDFLYHTAQQAYLLPCGQHHELCLGLLTFNGPAVKRLLTQCDLHRSRSREHYQEGDKYPAFDYALAATMAQSSAAYSAKTSTQAAFACMGDLLLAPKVPYHISSVESGVSSVGSSVCGVSSGGGLSNVAGLSGDGGVMPAGAIFAAQETESSAYAQALATAQTLSGLAAGAGAHTLTSLEEPEVAQLLTPYVASPDTGTHKSSVASHAATHASASSSDLGSAQSVVGKEQLLHWQSLFNPEITMIAMEPNTHGQWQRCEVWPYRDLWLLGGRRGRRYNSSFAFFREYSIGALAHRERWALHYSLPLLKERITRSVAHFNAEVERKRQCAEAEQSFVFDDLHDTVKTTRFLEQLLETCTPCAPVAEDRFFVALAHPFCKKFFYAHPQWLNGLFNVQHHFPYPAASNLTIIVSQRAAEFSCLMTDCFCSGHTLDSFSQLFSRYLYYPRAVESEAEAATRPASPPAQAFSAPQEQLLSRAALPEQEPVLDGIESLLFPQSLEPDADADDETDPEPKELTAPPALTWEVEPEPELSRAQDAALLESTPALTPAERAFLMAQLDDAVLKRSGCKQLLTHLSSAILLQEDKQQAYLQRMGVDTTDYSREYQRVDGISPHMIALVRRAYTQYAALIDADAVFFYVYGMLHSSHWRQLYARRLRWEPIRIPLVASFADFWHFMRAGQNLAWLHVRYEEIEPYVGCEIDGVRHKPSYRLTKARYGTFAQQNRERDRSVIFYNEHFLIRKVPPKARWYRVNGRPALDDMISRLRSYPSLDGQDYNDINLWAQTMGDEQYFLKLILRMITVCVKTEEIVSSLPVLRLGDFSQRATLNPEMPLPQAQQAAPVAQRGLQMPQTKHQGRRSKSHLAEIACEHNASMPLLQGLVFADEE